MSGVAIKVENLGKQYRIGGPQARYKTLRDSITDAMAAPFRRAAKLLRGHAYGAAELDETIWALKDISFEVNQGDVIGIIGRNGAGKSTLLKILSRITEPTEGKVKIFGRVGSLLEVGTGFHSELTGRENIFLNGAILGMKKAEIERKFDEIVTFSEIEKFIDTPVKHYSSGMYMRLAFAVASHTEPEILLVDEVLAVGDAQFQKKCLGRMDEVGKEGRTVLFVSHNMTAIKALCKRGVLLENGKIAYDGDVSTVTEKYLSGLENSHKNIPLSQRKREKYLPLYAKIIDFSLISEDKVNPILVKSNKPFMIRLTIQAEKNTRAGIYLAIRDSNQVLIWMASGHLHNMIYEFKKGTWQIDCQIDPTFLSSGDYRIDCGLDIPNQQWIDFLPDVYYFTVSELDPYGSGFNLTQRFARYHVDHKWSPAVLIG
jgi:lipopolysaccharide transport system ATP-binding protein